MSVLTSNHHIISYLLRHNVSHAMIKILEDQRINDEDLQMMDRDDVEHLFKNDYGFTFRDRKQFWSAIQKIQPTIAKNDVIYIEQEVDTPDVYDIVDDEPPNYPLPQHYIPLSSPNISSPRRMYEYSIPTNRENHFEPSSCEEDDDTIETATTSLPVRNRYAQRYQLKNFLEFQFVFPVDLPKFSSKVMRAFEENNIQGEWQTLVNELARWVLTKKHSRPLKREYQAIGKTIYKQYPSIGRDGFRPWSTLCRHLTQKLRRERSKIALARAGI